MISLYPSYCEKVDNHNAGFFETFSDLTGKTIIPFSCARAAMVFGLRSLGIDRMDEILVPPWLGHCVLSALSRTSFPSMVPSCRTKAIFVFHQLGYPQRLEDIEGVALENGWVILNDCANTLFSGYKGGGVAEWGDFSVFSFSKLYPCTMGGALLSSRNEIQAAIEANYKKLCVKSTYLSNEAHGILEKEKRGVAENEFTVDAVYGYIPELVAFPSNALQGLPNTDVEIKRDIEHRRRVLHIVSYYFPDNVPDCCGIDVVPFAVPLTGFFEDLERLSIAIKKEVSVDVPVLHFDFERNLLNPDYRKSLIIGCHAGWSEELVVKICELIKKKTKTANHAK